MEYMLCFSSTFFSKRKKKERKKHDHLSLISYLDPLITDMHKMSIHNANLCPGKHIYFKNETIKWL